MELIIAVVKLPLTLVQAWVEAMRQDPFVTLALTVIGLAVLLAVVSRGR